MKVLARVGCSNSDALVFGIGRDVGGDEMVMMGHHNPWPIITNKERIQNHIMVFPVHAYFKIGIKHQTPTVFMESNESLAESEKP